MKKNVATGAVWSGWIAAHAKRCAVASFFGMLTGMVPMIVVTYGFALVWLPVVASWSATLCFGVRAGQRRLGVQVIS